MSAPLTKTLGIITGLIAEARCAKLTHAATFCSGADPLQAEKGARAMVENGAKILLSFGLAGGLDPALKPGDVLLPEKIITTAGEALFCDPALRKKLAEHFPAAKTAPLYGTDVPLLASRDKHHLYRETGAGAADMESHVVGRIAAENHLPFIVLRVIADPAGRDVPAIALSGVGKDGKTRPFAVVKNLLRQPWDLPGLLGLAWDTRKALGSLRRVGNTLGHIFL